MGTGAMGQIFIFITIAKFGALTCSIIGLARKVTTLVASIYFYGHVLNNVQFMGLLLCITCMVMNFLGKKKGGGKKGSSTSSSSAHGHHDSSSSTTKDHSEDNDHTSSEREPMLKQQLQAYHDDPNDEQRNHGDIEIGPFKDSSSTTTTTTTKKREPYIGSI